MRLLFYFLSIVSLTACVQKGDLLSAQDIIDKAIEKSCGENCESLSLEFTFRDRRYIRKRYEGTFEYQRITYGDQGVITDILTNDGFKRFINDTLIQIPDSMAIKYSNSVNSVHYFSQLPYGLNDDAVNKKLLGTDTINDVIYYKVKVTFDKDGGGKDYEDVFIFWIHQKDFTVDYLAYEYFTDGGGIRFREAYNERLVNSIRFVDYNNYKPKTNKIELQDMGKLFSEGKLVLLSKIKNEDLKVTLKNGVLVKVQ